MSVLEMMNLIILEMMNLEKIMETVIILQEIMIILTKMVTGTESNGESGRPVENDNASCDHTRN